MEPVEVFAGATWAWEVTVSDYSAADGWSLHYICTNASGAFEFNDDGTAGGTTFAIDVAAATTSAFTPGDYTWQLFAEKGAEKHFISSGPLKVNTDISSGTTAHDSRSHVKKTLDALEAVIEGKAGKDQLSYSINGRSLTRMGTDELLKWRRQYRAEYRQELAAARIAAGRGNPNTVKATFKGASS
jgi:hypothetical protein